MKRWLLIEWIGAEAGRCRAAAAEFLSSAEVHPETDERTIVLIRWDLDNHGK